MIILNKIAKNFILIVLWCVFSPLYFFLSKKWNIGSKRRRWIQLLISPLLLIIYGLVGVACFISISLYNSVNQFRTAQSVSILTEVDFPKFKIISKESSDINFRGEHSVRYTIKFKEMPSDDFYKQVDSIILKHKNDERGLFYTPGWYKKDTINYSYNKLWFGSPPKGLDVGNHMQVTIDLNRNSNIAEISYCEM